MPDLIITSQALHFTCRMCGKCCRNNWKIPIDPDIFSTYVELSKTDDYIKNNFSYRLNNEGFPFLNQCSFLTDENRCYIHGTYGADFLSSVCCAYPRFFVKTPRGVECGLSYSCPAALHDLNGNLSIIQTDMDNYNGSIPHKIRELRLDENYFTTEHKMIEILSAGDFNSDVLKLLKELTVGNEYPAMKYLETGFSKQTLLFAAMTFTDKTPQDLILKTKTADPDFIKQIESAEKILLDKIGESPSNILSNYFMNFVFTKSFYPYRELFEDMYLMMVFVYKLVLFYAAVEWIAGENSNFDQNTDDTLLRTINLVENNFIHNSRLSTETLIYLADWY